MVTVNEIPSVSIVIAFRDWGLERLELCLKSVRESLMNVDHEVIVSDYGSSAKEEIESICARNGATHLFTRADVWSKPRALNKGFRKAKNDVIISLDADMIVSPSTLPLVADTVSQVYPSAAVVPSRDLPEELDELGVKTHDGDWAYLETHSRMRARWGVGGCFGFHRAMLDTLGGVDQRMERYAVEDLDFTDRCRRMGARVVWLDQPDARIYHVWHESTFIKMESDPAIQEAVARNREIYYNDKTISRNVFEPRDRRASVNPLVSVIISTYNRGDLIAESIYSVLSQSINDFELIIVDDGSSDNTGDIVNSITDDRIRYFRIENSGISAARNYGFKKSKGAYIAVHDDDDLMVPDRLEKSLASMVPGIAITYGSHINFDDFSGELTSSVMRTGFGEKFIKAIASSPGHSTWMARREVYESLSYDEELEAGVDHNFAIRSVSQGWTWAHTSAVLLMRRQHVGQITGRKGNPQENASRQTLRWFRESFSADELSEARKDVVDLKYPSIEGLSDLRNSFGAWLPDSLVNRAVTVLSSIPIDELDLDGRLKRVARKLFGQEERCELYLLSDATWRDLATLRYRNLSYSYYSHWFTDDRSIDLRDVYQTLLRSEICEDATAVVFANHLLSASGKSAVWKIDSAEDSPEYCYVFNHIADYESWHAEQESLADVSILMIGMD